MTVPNFLASSFYFSTGSSPITDVATVITDVRTILLSTNNPPWTEPTAGVFQSPIDSGGRFMRITLVKNTATRLNVTLQDNNLLTVYAREFDILSTGALVNYYTGQYHFYLESQTGTTTADIAYGSLLDPSPYGVNTQAGSGYVTGTTLRNTAGNLDGNGSNVDVCFSLESGVAQPRQRGRAVGQTGTAVLGLLDFQGNPQLFPHDIWVQPSAIGLWGGKEYQVYMVPTSCAAGTVKKIALDDGTLASFRVLFVPSYQGMLKAVRVA